MKIIPRDAKILNITHVDFDGCGCSIVLGNVFKNIRYKFSSFYNIDEKLESTNYDEYDYILLTDIHPQ
jgi:oligoribonuclease NrnB/cAMP/cGMP phosphodiesterase (DHH superfamily)